jgi:ribosomal protein S18 acetylase RimI-like enzyme
MGDTHHLVIRTDPEPAEVAFLEDRLYEFNAQATGLRDALGLAIFGRDDRGEVVAGLCGHTWGGSCEIRQLWVHENHRGRGLGRQLLELAETEARRRGCFQLILATHSFQAPEFYRRHGFEIVASIPDHPRGHQHLHLRKVLEAGARERASGSLQRSTA